MFADLNIYDAASVVGQFIAYLAPTFFLGTTTFTLDPVALVVSDMNKVPYPLLANPTMFSINGFNYVLDTNRVPHAVIGNNNVSPLATDVTVQSGQPIPNSTFTLNGLVYMLTEDASHNLLAITGTKSYPIAQPAQTFKLDSTLVFTLATGPAKAGGYAGSVAPIGTVTATGASLNLYAGTPESGNADYFMYKNVLYTLVKSGTTYVAVQKSYTVYAAHPVTNQQQLAVFDLAGTTYMVTDGTTAGAATKAGINAGTMWAQTATTTSESQFGLVYGFIAQPTNVTQSVKGVFQFQVTDSLGNITLYDIIYTSGGNTNIVTVDVPNLLPDFTQSPTFGFVPSCPLMFETGGYNAFTTSVAETTLPSESFAGSYRTPVVSTDSGVDNLISAQGDFSLEFWHSLPLTGPTDYHPVTYSASTTTPLVYYLDVDFANTSTIFIGINGAVLRATVTKPVPSSGWRHFALTYQQPYVMLFNRAGSTATDAGSAFEVQDGSNYDFSRDFSIAMTFSATDVTAQQGLLYKGTGSDITSPELSMSYSVGINDGAVTLSVTDGDGATHTATGAAVLKVNTFYQVVIVKQTASPAGNPGSSDPYTASDPYATPVDISDMSPAATAGANADTEGFPSGSGNVKMTNMVPSAPGAGKTTKLQDFLSTVQTFSAAKQSFTVSIAVREIFPNGTYDSWQFPSKNPASFPVNDDSGLWVNATGSAHLLIGAAYDDGGTPWPMGGAAGVGNIRDVYLFNAAINPEGIKTRSGIVAVQDASSDELTSAGVVGYWRAAYDPNGVVNNVFDQTAVAVSTNAARAFLAALKGQELEATSLYIDGYSMTLSLVTDKTIIPPSMGGYTGGSAYLIFNAGTYKLEEISIWQMVRQPYQILDDMFGRLMPSNEPFLAVYLSGEFALSSIAPQPTAPAPFLPMNSYIDNIGVANAGSLVLTFDNASLDLSGCPAVGRCGPLITPNLYNPPGVALTVCDTVPDLSSYSVTLNTLTTALAGEINEVYVYVQDHVLTLYAGKKVGDLVLSWVSQEQGDVQLIGYVEGAPPCPMVNMTNKPGTNHLEPTTVYVGATSISFIAPTSVTVTYQNGEDYSYEGKQTYDTQTGVDFAFNMHISPLRVRHRSCGGRHVQVAREGQCLHDQRDPRRDSRDPHCPRHRRQPHDPRGPHDPRTFRVDVQLQRQRLATDRQH